MYPPRGGVVVRGLCMERLGRHGPGLAQTLAELADLVRQRDMDRGQAPRRWLRSWRAQLSAACVRSSHLAIAAAAEDLQGRLTARPGPRHIALMLSADPRLQQRGAAATRATPAYSAG